MSEKRIWIVRQLAPPEPTWTAESVPDQTGKVVLITGGNRGIGKETARALLSKGAKVYIATRSEERAQNAITELKAATGKDSIFFIKLDLADLPSVKAAAEEFISKESELHTLYNNAGVMYTPVDRLTDQGHGLQFGTNVLGHFYLTQCLLPVLTATAKKAPEKTVRVVNVSSIGHYFGVPEGIRWSTLGRGDDSVEEREKLGAVRLFGQSKTGTILFSNELAKRYGGEGIVSISLNPGTDISRQAGSLAERIGRLLKYALYYVVSCGDVNFLAEESRAMADSAENAHTTVQGAVANLADGELPKIDVSNTHGAITSLYAGTASAAGELNGKYLTAWARVTLPHRKALNPETAKKLWEWCEEQVKDGNKAAA